MSYREILENATNFLLHAVVPSTDDRDDDESITSAKYLVLNVDAAGELLLKARICKEHWALLFSNVDKASLTALSSGDFTSVDLHHAMSRLSQIVDADLSATIGQPLEDLRSMRNRIQHLRYDITDQAARQISARALDSLLGFVEATFDETDLTRSAKSNLERLCNRLKEFHEYHKARLQVLETELHKLRDQHKLGLCPECGQETLELGPRVRCLYCRSSQSATCACARVATDAHRIREQSMRQLTLWGSTMPESDAITTVCSECGEKAMLVRSLPEAEVEECHCYACCHAIGLGTVDAAVRDLHARTMKVHAK